MKTYELLKEKYKQLKEDKKYKEARTLIKDYIEKSDKDNECLPLVIRALSEFTYQDKELEFNYAMSEGMKILDSIRNDDDKQETSCLRGAIKKRIWEKYRRVEDLIESIDFYYKGIGTNNEEKLKNKGYAAVNYVHMFLTLKKELEYVSNSWIDGLLDGNTESLKNKTTESLKQIIEETINLLVNVKEEDIAQIDKSLNEYKDHWYYSTLAELSFYIKDYKNQEKFINKCLEQFNNKSADDKERQVDRTFEQLLKASRIVDHLDEEHFKKILKLFVNYDEIDVTKILDGKVGLALSGGGFRASFFHIGVLARLAELDKLKDVEAISTVSGGSIVGVDYYLKLKILLESTADKDIKQNDYIKIVENLEKDFLEGVQTNIRNATFMNFKDNLEVLTGFVNNFSRTNLLGRYYQKEFYDKNKFEDNKTLSKMNELRIKPKDAQENFHPYYHNIKRTHKVPNIIINATNLNSGHCWVFTATGMGELESMSSKDVDKNKMYVYDRYENFENEDLQNFKISDAVAASSAVPALFDPIIIQSDFLEEKIKLADGGVYDNQGIQALLSDNCLSIICSDASGYFKNEENPSSNRFDIMTRMTDNMMDVIKDYQYRDLTSREKDGSIRSLTYIHLKDHLPIFEVDFKERKQYPLEEDRKCTKTRYGISIDLQEKLASIRTDLDAFNDAEAYSLMCSGYLITKYQCKEKIKNDDEAYKGEFLKFKEILAVNEEANKKRKTLSKILDISREKFFKIILLNKKYLKIIVIALVILELMSFGSYIIKPTLHLIDSYIGYIGYALVLLLVINSFAKKYRLMNAALNFFIIPFGVLLHINKYTLERFYLCCGKTKMFIKGSDSKIDKIIEIIKCFFVKNSKNNS
jgi:predicted acylesterase/phospholipase RssA